MRSGTVFSAPANILKYSQIWEYSHHLKIPKGDRPNRKIVCFDKFTRWVVSDKNTDRIAFGLALQKQYSQRSAEYSQIFSTENISKKNGSRIWKNRLISRRDRTSNRNELGLFSLNSF